MIFARITACRSLSGIGHKQNTEANECTHELKHQVDIPIVLCLQDFVQSDDVLVPTERSEEEDFTEGSLCISGVRKGIKYLL